MSVYKLVGPSVASIAIVKVVGGAAVREAIGSGVVWDDVGPHVLTNFHILPPLQGSSTVLQVTVRDVSTGVPTTLGARVAGTDSLHDLAVLRLLPLAASASGQEGQPQEPELVLAGENGLPSLRPVRLGTSADLRTDALINAANSGGPLVDSAGRLVGLSTAVGGARAGAVRGSGVCFALPADMLRDLVPKIIVYGNPYGKK
ncbi:hypothetical protein GPECTOR_14g23 [Gonium pectorale]|uniref:Protease Do-like PDZ domain-containing protein n=1 Tax=Gonium pectorale TaxID=33097 RepID=A0A150GMJ1_GONPE|nr:hypothetical protein GPECTOR_14g23 [Gonium pectorale]|eukprot:KXZ50988.1 hypothetical protein GPECTOR_14g23 [Gonium pectorale]